MSSANDPAFARYTAADGAIYPHIVVPRTPAAREAEGSPSVTLKATPTTSPLESWIKTLKLYVGSYLQQTASSRAAPTSEKQPFWRRYSNLALDTFLYYTNLADRRRTVPLGLRIPPTAPIRAFAWHKYKQRFAVALQNNFIHLYDLGPQAWSPLALKHEFQRDISIIEWKPLSGQILAVGCGAGVCVWTILTAPVAPGGQAAAGGDAGTASSSYSEQSAWMSFLTYPDHAPVNALAWNPNGRTLASGSANSGEVIIWDVVTATPTPLGRSGSGILALKWSPTGEYLCATYTSGGFTVWETRTWKSELWANISPYCQSVVWSGDGKHLAVAGANSQIHFFSLPSIPPTINASFGTPTTAGGQVSEIAWDPSSKRFVVSFQDSPLIALAQCISPTMKGSTTQFIDFIPLGFLRGPPDGGRSTFTTFHPQSLPTGALLSTCWENGKISFYPLYFK